MYIWPTSVALGRRGGFIGGFEPVPPGYAVALPILRVATGSAGQAICALRPHWRPSLFLNSFREFRGRSRISLPFLSPLSRSLSLFVQVWAMSCACLTANVLFSLDTERTDKTPRLTYLPF